VDDERRHLQRAQARVRVMRVGRALLGEQDRHTRRVLPRGRDELRVVGGLGGVPA
jgi:hypothetical protein